MADERWTRARATLKLASPYLALAALPLALLLANDTWIWDSPSYRDTNVYVGFFRHYLEFSEPFVANYKSSRLPFVLPGVALYRWLPPGLAHHVLFLLFLTGGAFALYLWARRRFGAHAAFAAAAAMTVFTFSHAAPSYHNQAVVAYFTAAIALADLPEKLPAARRALFAGAAFALAVSTDLIVIGLAPVIALRIAVAEPSVLEASAPRSPVARLATRAGAALLGAALAVAALGAVNVALGGPFLFFMDQVTMSLHLAKAGELSSVPLLSFATRIADFPWLVLPVVAMASAFAWLASRALRRPGSATAVDAACLLLSIAAAAFMQLRGLGILEQPHLFQPFFAPTFLALAALAGGHRGAPRGPPGAAFLTAVATLVLFPVCAVGAPLSLWLVRVARAWPTAAHGVPLSFAVAAACAVVVRRVPLSRGALRALPAAGSFGLINALSAAPSQPAYLYQLGARCPFRREAFDALIAADDALSAFDPRNEARWLYGALASNETVFDGRGWCTLVPVDAAARDLLLTHYFYTSAEFVHGYRPPARPTKLVIVARDAARADGLLAGFLKEAQPPATTVSLHVERTFPISASSVVLRGYDVTRPASE